MNQTCPFQLGAPGGRSGKWSIHGPFIGTLVARVRSTVFTLALFDVGSSKSPAVGECHTPPSLMSSWLPLGALYSLSAIFWSSMFRRRSIGRMLRSWCNGSCGVVWKVPEISLTTSFWMTCSFLTSVICLPVYQSWQPYVSTVDVQPGKSWLAANHTDQSLRTMY